MTVPREALDAALRRIEQSLLTMGGLVEKSLHSAVRSLLEQDLNLARQVVEDDDIIDELEVELETQGLQVIAMFPTGSPGSAPDLLHPAVDSGFRADGETWPPTLPETTIQSVIHRRSSP